jgi:1-acyl-sn-glycerol-3-phosphate acyltransferase
MQNNRLYEMTRMVIQAYSSLLLRMDVHWHEPRLPDGPKIFVANHPSASDPFLLCLLPRGHLSVFVSGSAFSVPLFGRYLRHTRQIAVRPEEGGQALEQARGYLEAGHSIGIFPEGNFSPQEGGFLQPRSGAARLALSSGAPVVPVGIYLPRERTVRISSRLSGRPTVGYWYLRGPYGMTVGQPMHFHGDIEDREHVAAVSSTMMHRIKSLAYESEQRVRAQHPQAAAAAGAL